MSVSVSACGFEACTFVEEHWYIRGICGCRDCRVGYQHYLIMSVDPWYTRGR
jgi:hypothetical protein